MNTEKHLTMSSLQTNAPFTWGSMPSSVSDTKENSRSSRVIPNIGTKLIFGLGLPGTVPQGSLCLPATWMPNLH